MIWLLSFESIIRIGSLVHRSSHQKIRMVRAIHLSFYRQNMRKYDSLAKQKWCWPLTTFYLIWPKYEKFNKKGWKSMDELYTSSRKKDLWWCWLDYKKVHSWKCIFFKGNLKQIFFHNLYIYIIYKIIIWPISSLLYLASHSLNLNLSTLIGDCLVNWIFLENCIHVTLWFRRLLEPQVSTEKDNWRCQFFSS